MLLYRGIYFLTDIFFKVLEIKYKLGIEFCGMLGVRSWSGSILGCVFGWYVFLLGCGGRE